MSSSYYHGEEKRQPNAEDWLNLHLGKNPLSRIRGNESQEVSTPPAKVFSCRYCMRRFYSSQALGGHQNAHKRERGAVRRYPSQDMMAMTTSPFHNSMITKSLSLQVHSLAHKTGRDKEGPMVAKFNEANTVPQMVSHPLTEETTIWPGSFRLNTHTMEQQQLNPSMLDLNLKL